MSASRAKVFLSHISEEAGLATIINRRIRKDFLGLVDVFQSSDPESVQTGTNWLDAISEALRESKIFLVLCSPSSLAKPWINFESGAGWVKSVPVMPICHTGIRPVELPLPLNLLQAIEASKLDHWPRVYRTLAAQLGSQVPEADFREFVGEIQAFEREYGYLRKVRGAVGALTAIDSSLTKLFAVPVESDRGHGNVREDYKQETEPHLAMLKSLGLVDYSFKATNLAPFQDGYFTMFDMTIIVEPRYYEIAEEVVQSPAE